MIPLLRFALAACLLLVLAGSTQPIAGTYFGLVGDRAYLLALQAASGGDEAGHLEIRGAGQKGQFGESSMRLVRAGVADELLLYPEEFAALPVLLTIRPSSAGVIIEGEGIAGSMDRIELAAGAASAFDRMTDVLRARSQHILASTAAARSATTSAVEDAGCGCGEGKMARVTQATRKFAVTADSLLSGMSGLVAATELHLSEFPRIETRYRAAVMKARGQLSGGTSKSAGVEQSALEVEAWHGAVIALTTAFEQSRRSLDHSLEDAMEACQRREPVSDAAMSPEIRQWSNTCVRIKDAAPRFRTAVTEWEGGIRALRELDRIQWHEWNDLTGQISNAE